MTAVLARTGSRNGKTDSGLIGMFLPSLIKRKTLPCLFSGGESRVDKVYNKRYNGDKMKLAGQGSEALQIINRGGYTTSTGLFVDITDRMKACVDGTRLYRPDDFPNITPTEDGSPEMVCRGGERDYAVHGASISRRGRLGGCPGRVGMWCLQKRSVDDRAALRRRPTWVRRPLRPRSVHRPRHQRG